LTTIAQPIYAMGAITSDMLLGAIRDSDYDQSRCVLAPELIIRNSTHRRTLPG
jgi:DNA-binding LacI/PurR family transcriptional regulator